MKKKCRYIYSLLAFCLLVVIFFGSCKSGESESEGLYGVDLSHHNTVEDWDKVTASSVYLKSTEGETHHDEKFIGFVNDARKRGIAVGAYHFMTTSSSAKSQFFNFYNRVKKVKLDLVPVLDIERQTKGYPVSKKS